MFSNGSGKSKRRYGYFRCPSCNQRWESSHVYVKGKGGFPEKAEYGQQCKNCEEVCFPYRLERLKCSRCGEQDCICTDDEDRRHIDESKPHRADLCMRCKAGLPCTG